MTWDEKLWWTVLGALLFLLAYAGGQLLMMFLVGW
jgi:hypothetical protein